MSWDILLMNVSDNIKSSNDLPHDFKSNLGISADVLSILSRIVPEIDLHDPMWGTLEGDGFLIEFNIGDQEPITSITLHIRGSDNAVDIVKRICTNTGWRAIDFSTGNFIDFENNPENGLHVWRTYKNQIVKPLKK